MKTDNASERREIIDSLINAINRIESYEGSCPDRDVILSDLTNSLEMFKEATTKKKKN